MTLESRHVQRAGAAVTGTAAVVALLAVLGAVLLARQDVAPTPAQAQPGDEAPADTADAAGDDAADAQDGDQPAPAPGSEPAPTPATGSEPAPGDAPAIDAAPALAVDDDDDAGPVDDDGMTTLAFKEVSVDRLVPFIVEVTGKVVLPSKAVMTKKVTVLNNEKIPKQRALDFMTLAMFREGISVVVTDEMILLGDLDATNPDDVPVIGPDESVLGRTDVGVLYQKVYTLRNSSAENLGEVLKEDLPTYVKIAVDKDSNQIAVLANIAYLQQMERLISSLDRPNTEAPQARTFRLRFADADQIAENITDLFEQTQAGAGQRGGPQNFQFGRGRDGGGEQRAAADGRAQGVVGPSANLRVTANTQQNSVTVVAEPTILAEIEKQIYDVWDKPLPEEAVVPRIYELQNSDPIAVRDLLQRTFGSASTGSSTGGGGGGGGGGQGNFGGGGGGSAPSSAQGVGRLAGQFSFEAIPESGRLLVVAKSPDNLAVIDNIIADLDKPQSAGLPTIIELKHASAEELAEQLNALLAEEGTLASINRVETGLSDDTSSTSPFATDPTGEDGTAQEETSPGTLSFWWQRARPPEDNRGASNLVGRIRIVPVWRQNAVLVLSPPEYRQPVVDLIANLDKPGRQVLISAIIAEISLEDADALGLRWSNTAITPNNQDNVFSITTNTTAQQNDFLGGLFDTSVLDASVDLNVLFQALNEKTAVNILSEPRIFTSDNQEAEFFDGQDIPFVTDTQTNNDGNLVQSFDYRAVGIQLRVRPRITVNRDVDLRVNLELSSIQPQQTLFGGFVVDRRETTTQLIVQDGQTIVLSGIRRSEDSDVRRKVPLLGDIPLVGLIFNSTEKVRSTTELVAFITPLVVDNPSAMDSVNQPYRERLDELRDMLDKEAPKDDQGQPIP